MTLKQTQHNNGWSPVNNSMPGRLVGCLEVTINAFSIAVAYKFSREVRLTFQLYFLSGKQHPFLESKMSLCRLKSSGSYFVYNSNCLC